MMKTNTKESHKSPGTATRHSKSPRKIKKQSSKEVGDHPEPLAKRELIDKKIDDVELSKIPKQQLDKRKPDGNEWKGLKKADYQRLETVVEEGHDDTVKTDGENTSEPAVTEASPGKTKKPWFFNMPLVKDKSEELKFEDCVQSQKSITKKAKNKDDNIINEARGEPLLIKSKELDSDSCQAPRNSILNGMMEILPIFSNDKFVSSRDALSVGECEDIDAFDKNLSGKHFSDGKNAKDPKGSFNATKKEDANQPAEKVNESKDTERKYRYKAFTEKNTVTDHTSPFINSLLVLAPFAEERKAINERSFAFGGKNRAETQIIQEPPAEGLSVFRVIYAFIFTMFSAISMFLGVAWRSYQPPCLLDYIIEFVPFVKRRRTYVQLFFDQILKLLSNVYHGSCKIF